MNNHKELNFLRKELADKEGELIDDVDDKVKVFQSASELAKEFEDVEPWIFDIAIQKARDWLKGNENSNFVDPEDKTVTKVLEKVLLRKRCKK